MAAGKKRSESKRVDSAAAAPKTANAAAAQSERIVDDFLAAVAPLAAAAPTERHAKVLLEAARHVAGRLRLREVEFEQLFRITERVSYGVSLDETLDFVYDEMREVIPYNRIGFSLIDEKTGEVWARWARSDREMRLGLGYRAPLEGSTLKDILETREPRILNDLEDYLKGKPTSDSTRLIVAEGMRSSLTCPLIVRGKPVGFMFFSSAETDRYSDAHVTFFQQIAGQLSSVVEKGRLYTDLDERKTIIQTQNEAMTRDLDLARQVQQALIPERAPEVHGLDVALKYEPAIQVGGDLLDVIALDDARVVLFVADAMGHGVSAALVMSVVKASLQTAVETDANPAAVLTSVNRALVSLWGFGFVTAACCLVSADRTSAEIALAGHAPPVWFHADTDEVTHEGDGGLPLGVDRNARYASARIEPAPGDVLVFYTDGVVEAMDPQGNQYGTERLVRQTRAGARRDVSGLLAGVWRDIEGHLAGREPRDDVTLLAVKMAPAPAEYII